jgi:CubicO group peptidase (beta-lactamase class C family)
VNTAIVFDALLVSSLLGTIVLLVVLAVAGRRMSRSAHVQHQVLCYALLTMLGTFALTAVLAPGPTGCLARECGDDARPKAGVSRAHEYYTYAAAGKFADLATPNHTGNASHAARSDVATSQTVDASRAARTDFAGIVIIVWLAGALLGLAGIAGRRRAAWRIVRESQPIANPRLAERLAAVIGEAGLTVPIRLAWHPLVTVPAVTGIRRPTLLLPMDFEAKPAAAQNMVLRHETAHLRRRDGAASLLGEVAVAVFWFNPAVRIAARRMRDLQEIAADSAVLRAGITASSYADFLLDWFRNTRGAQYATSHGGHAILGDCQMETRLRTILDPRTAHGLPSRMMTTALRGAFVAAGVCLVLVPSALEALVQRQGARQVIEPERALLTHAALDSLLRPVFINHMADRYIAGAAIAVVHEGEVVYRSGFGRREVYHEAPVDAERTIWRIGSITKFLTGIAVMQLVDRGLVDLDADVNRYLTDMQVPATFAEPVRVRHLLTHTAGFDQIGLGRHARRPEDVLPLGEFLRDNLIRIRPPGQLTTYDTYAITLAGHLVEQVTGLSYEEYLQRHLFRPLAMHRSTIAVPPALQNDVAVGYGFAGTWEAAPWEYMNTDPASTVNSTVTDMANLMIAMLEGGRFEDRQILSESSVDAMLTRQFTNHPDQPGYGFTLFEDDSYGVSAFSHGGSMTGFGAFLYLVPEHRLGVFIASNQESGSLAHVALATLTGAVFPGHAQRPALRERLPRSNVSRFAGRYANSMYHHTDPTRGWRIQPFALTVDAEGRLVFDGAPAFPVGPLTFQRDDGVLLTFRENSRGEITHFFVNQTVYERLR